MDVLEQLDTESRSRFNDLIGDGLLATLTTIRTSYVDKSEDFSGTGLMVSDGSSKYVLTADHVLTPSRRVPPRTLPTTRHYHSSNLRRESGSAKAFALRNKYYRSESLDLALAESVLSGRPDFDSREDYFPIETLKHVADFDIWENDLFVMCGFPRARLTTISVPYEARHGMLIHYFSGAHGGNDPASEYCYRFRFDGDRLSPRCLSGAPVWVLRDHDNPNRPLDLHDLLERSGKPLTMLPRFCGVAVRYLSDGRYISAVKPAYCSAFVRKAIAELPSFHSREEDEWISEQLAYLSQREG